MTSPAHTAANNFCSCSTWAALFSGLARPSSFLTFFHVSCARCKTRRMLQQFPAWGFPFEKTLFWITDLALNADTVWDIMRGGRARWKIENETFNTLKNQGYHLEHNYGHGEQNLSVVLALMMMLAFLVDQVQQLCCPLFQAAWSKMKTKCHLWEEIRHHFRTLLFDSMAELLTALIRGIAPQKPVFENSS